MSYKFLVSIECTQATVFRGGSLMKILWKLKGYRNSWLKYLNLAHRPSQEYVSGKCVCRRARKSSTAIQISGFCVVEWLENDMLNAKDRRADAYILRIKRVVGKMSGLSHDELWWKIVIILRYSWIKCSSRWPMISHTNTYSANLPHDTLSQPPHPIPEVRWFI